MPQPIVWYSSDETGAPTLNNAAGSLINVLDACLVNGFNSKSVTSINVASNVATAVISAHGYAVGRVIEIAGATPSGLNGRQKVASVVNANTITFATTGVADGAATGTITARRPPLGWVKAHTGTNKAAYARSDVTALAMKLRIDDTGAGSAAATYARAVMYETMSDVDTGTGPAPTVAQIAAGQYWYKGANSATAKKWSLVGDSHAFYLIAESPTYTSGSNYGGLVFGFGDLVPYRSGDAYSAFLIGADNSEADPFPQSVTANHAFTGTFYTSVLSRPFNQIGSAVAVRMLSLGGSAVLGGNTYPAYPSPVDNGLVLSYPTFAVEASPSFANPIRGEFPGIHAPLGNVIGLLDRTVLSSVIGLSGDLLILECNSTSVRGALGFDITNAWR